MTANTPVKYRLAYTADLEATFTPVFKLMLDHDDNLFAPGDDRVASLFLWHFVEEVEHRSSALIIYDAVVEDPWYRMRMAPSVFKHVWAILKVAVDGFNKHVPVEERKIDATSMFGMQARKKALLQRIQFLDAPDDGPIANGSTATTTAPTAPSGMAPVPRGWPHMSDLCSATFSGLAERLGFSCDTAGGLIAVRNPAALENWTLPVLELTVIVGAVLALVYAVVRLRRHNDPTDRKSVV